MNVHVRIKYNSIGLDTETLKYHASSRTRKRKTPGSKFIIKNRIDKRRLFLFYFFVFVIIIDFIRRRVFLLFYNDTEDHDRGVYGPGDARCRSDFL